MAKKKSASAAAVPANGAVTPMPAPAMPMFMPQPMAMPPTINASQFAVTNSVQEILLTFGHSRIPIDPQSGNPNGMAREWLTSISMSPTSAKALSTVLSATVQAYEKLNGRIPMDDAVTKQTLAALDSGFKAAKAKAKAARKSK